MADRVEVCLGKADITRKRSKERPTCTDHNGHDFEVIARTHTKTRQIIDRDVPVWPDYYLYRTMTHLPIIGL